MPVDARRRRPGSRQAGFSAGELVAVLAIVGILVATGTPLLISYYQSARLKLAAQEVAAFLNQGRQLGIRENAGVCVQRASTAMQYYVGTACNGTAAANLTLPGGITLGASTNPITFDYLGAATPTTYTLTNSQDGHSLLVTVAISGRITIKAP